MGPTLPYGFWLTCLKPKEGSERLSPFLAERGLGLMPPPLLVQVHFLTTILRLLIWEMRQIILTPIELM